LRRDAARALWVAAGILLLAAAALSGLAGLGLDYLVKAALLYGLAAALVWRGLLRGPAPGPHPHAQFGAANRVTLGRLALGLLLAALIGEAALATPATQPAAWWAVVGVATLAAVLDAVDGPLARRAGLASRYGARFDMETDAWFTLLLCGLLWQGGQTGAWVLAAGPAAGAASGRHASAGTASSSAASGGHHAGPDARRRAGTQGAHRGRDRLGQQHLRGATLVDHVDRLVGQLAVIDVARGKLDRRLDGVVRVAQLVELLEIGLLALEDLDRIRHGRLVDVDLLEAAHQRAILLEVLPVFLVGR
jgi:hypothetical protein